MPIIALDSENEHIDQMLEALEGFFQPKKIPYIEKRGKHVVTIPRELSKEQQKKMDDISEGKYAVKYADEDADKIETKPTSAKENESNAQDAGAGNPRQGWLAAALKGPLGGKK
ncbi:hypothetical protein CEP54_013436 [Fusarium duplospermum]|uniref:Uncharacterized protein n=1 Tax=Fusarium duplospermum TaxID=1325734 RepID=A0A428P2X9_9HYPO|nr:hypothetical protein CEP54_013436 [Fusarium duplospermum]